MAEGLDKRHSLAWRSYESGGSPRPVKNDVVTGDYQGQRIVAARRTTREEALYLAPQATVRVGKRPSWPQMLPDAYVSPVRAGRGTARAGSGAGAARGRHPTTQFARHSLDVRLPGGP
jgi:hypothetical protein